MMLNNDVSKTSYCWKKEIPPGSSIKSKNGFGFNSHRSFNLNKLNMSIESNDTTDVHNALSNPNDPQLLNQLRDSLMRSTKNLNLSMVNEPNPLLSCRSQ